MNPTPPRLAARAGARALVTALGCVAALAVPRLSRAQCEPTTHRVDPLTQAVARMHAPKAAPRPRSLAHAAPRKSAITRGARPSAARLVTRVVRVSAPATARPVAADRTKPIVRKPRVQAKRAPRPVVCRSDSTMGIPALALVSESFGAVPASPFVAEMVASEDGPPTLAGLRPLQPLSPKPVVPRIAVVGSLPGSAPGAATGLTVAAATAGGVAWHFFWRPVGDPMRWNTDDRTPGGKPPVGVPPLDAPGRPAPPSAGDVPPADDPTAPRDSIALGGIGVTVGGNGGNGGGNGGGPGGTAAGDPWPGGPPGSGAPLFPDPIPGMPFPQIPYGDPLVPTGGPPSQPPGGPQSSVPEPATGGLIAAGAIAIGLVRTRKKRAD